jgi:hypothetical protein
LTNHEFESPEELELRRRLPMAVNEIRNLVERIKDVRLRANPESLPRELAGVEKKTLLEGLYRAIVEDSPPAVNRSVARRMADAIGDYLLWRREMTTPVIHELLVLAPWWVAAMPGEVFARLREIGLEYILNGRVVPLQAVWRDLLDSPLVFMGHCTCRSAKVADDLLRDDGRVFTIASDADNRLLLDRIMGRYDALIEAHGALPDTAPRYREMFARLAAGRAAGSPEYRLETLLASTYPDWEFLPVLADKYSPTWIRSLHANRKSFVLHKELAFELATTFYLAKGIVFSAMKFFDTPYCICSCPTPENAGGCVLTNWHYQGGSEQSLIPNDAVHGRRVDAAGRLLPCDKFPIRGARQCIGCGCVHGDAAPRSMQTILAEADREMAAYRRRETPRNKVD